MREMPDWILFRLKWQGPRTLTDLVDQRWLSSEYHKGLEQRSTAQVRPAVQASCASLLRKGLVKVVALNGLDHLAMPEWTAAAPAIIHVCSYSTMPKGAGSCGHLGGTVADAVQPLRWLTEHPKHKVFLSVSISKYWGQGEHWHVRITGNEDALWHREGHWFRPWDDSLGGLLSYEEQRARKGFSEDDKFNTIAAAEAWIERTINAGFSGREVWVRFEGEQLSNRTWSYREGD